MVSTKSSISVGQTIFSTYDVNQVKYQWGSNHFLYLWCQPSQVSVVVEPFSLPMVSAKSSISGVKPFSLLMVSAKSSISGGQTIFSTCGVNQVKYQWGRIIFTTCDVNQVKCRRGKTIYSIYGVNQVKYQWGSNHFHYL